MGLQKELVHGVFSYGFKHPSQIQALALKPIIERRHVIAQAQSGTGKTGAFGIGILNNLDISKGTSSTQALILAPTRELATQTAEFMQSIGSRLPGLVIGLFIGGHSLSEDQLHAQARPHVAVATPGRARDLLNSGHLRAEEISMLCLDEADQMLKEDFVDQVGEITEYLNRPQILLFSATMPIQSFNYIWKIMGSAMDDPVKILVKEEKLTLDGIRQFYVNVGEKDKKLITLLDIFGRLPIQKCVIFANRKGVVDFLKQQMEAENFVVSSIHSDMEQHQRDQIMHQFRIGASRVLIGTNLIARGIDVQQVTLVINFELAKDRESYIHRIGRSARWGRKGVAINICEQSEMGQIEDLMRHYNTEIAVLPDDIDVIVKEANDAVDRPSAQ
jgi:translation initiation factor 4A